MDFEFSEEQQAFAKEVKAFCDEHDDPDIFDVTRENMAQIESDGSLAASAALRVACSPVSASMGALFGGPFGHG